MRILFFPFMVLSFGSIAGTYYYIFKKRQRIIKEVQEEQRKEEEKKKEEEKNIYIMDDGSVEGED